MVAWWRQSHDEHFINLGLSSLRCSPFYFFFSNRFMLKIFIKSLLQQNRVVSNHLIVRLYRKNERIQNPPHFFVMVSSWYHHGRPRQVNPQVTPSYLELRFKLCSDSYSSVQTVRYRQFDIDSSIWKKYELLNKLLTIFTFSKI